MKKFRNLNKLYYPSESNKNWFFWIILYILIDYGRPQDVLPIQALRLGMVVTIVLFIYLVRYGEWQKVLFYSQIKLILFFILLLFLHIPFSRNNYFAWLTFKNMALFVPFILSVTICVNNLRRLKILINFLLIAMLYISLYALAHKGIGSGSYFNDENDLSLYLNMYLPFCFFLFFYEKKIRIKLLYLGLIGLSLLVTIISFSRGGFIGLLAIALVIWIISDKKILSLILLAIASIAFLTFASDIYLNEMKTISDSDSGTAIERIESWKSGWKMFLDNPLGVGGNNFLVRFPEYQTEYFQRGMWGRAAHSIWFTLIPELGIPGILVYYFLLRRNLKDIWELKKIKLKNERDQEYIRAISLSIFASLAGFFASGTFLSVLYYAHYWYITSIIIAMINIKNKLAGQLA